MITKYITGDITQTELEYIAHGVNCRNVMGSGVAKALFTKYPKVKTKYHEYPNKSLGQIQEVFCEDKLIINCFTQKYYGYDSQRYVNYAAIVECFKRIIEVLPRDSKLAIPKIGCGLAGGNWDFMEQLINDTVGDQLEIWVYEL